MPSTSSLPGSARPPRARSGCGREDGIVGGHARRDDDDVGCRGEDCGGQRLRLGVRGEGHPGGRCGGCGGCLPGPVEAKRGAAEGGDDVDGRPAGGAEPHDGDARTPDARAAHAATHSA